MTAVTPGREELLADIVDGAKSVIEQFDIAMASQSNSGADARLTALANYGEAGLEVLRALVRLAAKPADEGVREADELEREVVICSWCSGRMAGRR